MPDYIYNLYEAKTRLSNLIDRAAKGEEILIAKSGVPLAKLVPLPKSKAKRKPGGWEGKIRIPGASLSAHRHPFNARLVSSIFFWMYLAEFMTRPLILWASDRRS